MRKLVSTIAGASLFVAAFGLISKGIGFFREILFASIYGISTEFDIYLIGAVIPLVINTIILCLGQNYIIPTINKLKGNSEIFPFQFIRTIFYTFLTGGIILSIVLYALSDVVISSFIQSNETLKKEALNIYQLFLITIPISSVISVLIAYQQSNFEFRFSVISNLLLNISVLIIVFFFKELNIYAIPAGYIIGSLLQLFYLMSKSKELFSRNGELSPNFKNIIGFSSSTLVIIILIESIGQLYIVSDRLFYNQVSSGGISALNYAQTIYMLPLSIISITLSTVIFPKFSEFFSKKLFSELEKILLEALGVSIFIFTPIMFLLIYQGEIILKIIFERGKFSSADTILTSNVLFYYSLSIIFYAAYGILNKMIYSTGLIKKLLIITIIGITIKFFLNYLLVQTMEQNGLALSTSLSFLFFFITSFLLVFKKFLFSISFVIKELIFHVFICAFSIYMLKQISFLFRQNFAFHLFEIFIFIVIYISISLILKNSSLRIITQFFNRTILSR